MTTTSIPIVGTSARAGFPFVVVYTCAVFANAAILFSVEPMFAKLALPLLGGTPSVWNTALVFFQTALLVGYGYAHFSTRLLEPRSQVLLHTLVLAVSCAALPLQIRLAGNPPAGDGAILWLVLLLTVSLGLPFTVLASGAPLLQRWFASSDHPDAANPYFLYAASNLGSLIALLSYPFLIEPWATLATQRQVWSAFYVAVMVLIAACAWWSVRVEAPVSDTRVLARDVAAEAQDISMRNRVMWVVYAAVPSSLLMGATTYVSTDVAAAPLLWVVPLALYLLTFVLTFAARPPLRHSWMLRVEPYLLIIASLTMFWGVTLPGLSAVVFHFTLLFVVAMVCHGELARMRPPASNLTEFFLWVSVGGLVGGVFNALVAPLLFSGIIEYPLVIALAGLLRSGLTKSADTTANVQRQSYLDLGLPIAFGAALVGALAIDAAVDAEKIVRAIAISVGAIVLLSMASRPRRFGLGLLAVFLASGLRPVIGRSAPALRADRSFFGVYRVLEPAGSNRRELVHGTTLHGSQSLEDSTRLTPLTYYHPQGPMGDVFEFTVPGALPTRSVAVVGLGLGSLACYGRPGETWTFFEIDPLVLEIARDDRYFSFLKDCPPKTNVILGDARLTLASQPAAAYDMLVLDAFSSDAIPVHLLTREAFALYDRVLAQRGVLAVHVSNRHLDLEPIVASLASNAGHVARVRGDTVLPTGTLSTGRTAAIWILVARAEEDLGTITINARWTGLRAGGELWTDDFSNVLRVLR